MTASTGVVIQRRYVGQGNDQVERTSSWTVVGGIGDQTTEPGVVDPLLTDPIDFDAELAEREGTHEPLPPVEGDPHNKLFGI